MLRGTQNTATDTRVERTEYNMNQSSERTIISAINCSGGSVDLICTDDGRPDAILPMLLGVMSRKPGRVTFWLSGHFMARG